LIVFYIDAEQAKVCNLHVAQRPLIKRRSIASSDTDVTGDEANPEQVVGRRQTILNPQEETMKIRLPGALVGMAISFGRSNLTFPFQAHEAVGIVEDRREGCQLLVLQE
jgi:hypothetical protein